jgi:hypothetical protein
MNKFLIISLSLICFTVRGQLAVTVSPPKVTGQKTVVELSIKNGLTNEVQSARAICLLLDHQGKMVGQSTKWVIGQNKTGLDAKGEDKFNFVITSPQPLVTSNLTAKVIFSRVILAGGKLANVQQDVTVAPAAR